MTTARVSLDVLADDFELYAANFLKIVDRDGNLIPFRLNAGQKRLHDALERQRASGRPQRAIILKSRQIGFSTYAQAKSFHSGHLHQNRNHLTIAHKSDSAEILFQKAQIFWNNLPSSGPLAVRKKRFTKKLIHFEATDSRLQVEVVGESGRGFTAWGLHLSECAMYENIKTTLLAVKQAVPRRPGTFVIIESTPKGFNEFRTAYFRAKAGLSGYVAVFVPWFEDEESRMVRADFDERGLDEDERELVAKYGVTLDQLAWRRVKISDECDGDKEGFLQEYPSDDLSCFLSSGRPAFDRQGLEFQLAAVPPAVPDESLPPQSEIRWNAEEKRAIIEVAPRGRLRVYVDPTLEENRRHRFIVGADPSEGDPGSDPSPIAVLDQHTLKLAALWHGRAHPDLLADLMVMIARHYHDALLIWEANNHGVLVTYRVAELLYDNVYYRQVSEESVAREETDKPGYMASQKGRATLFDTYRKFIREQHSQLRDPVAVAELTTLVFENEKPQALEGFTDDVCVAIALCLQAHRGAADAPLLPLANEALRGAHASLGWKFGMGMKPTVEELKAWDMTCEELERYDEAMYKRDQRNVARGLGRMN